jgi:SAM-dependent methyltransferase
MTDRPEQPPGWHAPAEAMGGWEETLRGAATRATALLLEKAAAGPGDRVLEVGAGAGAETMRLAGMVGPDGEVLATDISEDMIRAAAARVHAAGLRNVVLKAMDAAAMDVPPRRFDAAVSRMGLMLFADPAAALRGMRAALRPGGRLAAMVFGAPARNPVHAVSMAVIRARLGLPPPPGDAPGYFRFGADGALAALMTEAGFEAVEIERVAGERAMTPATLRAFLAERAGGIRALLARAGEAERDAILDAVEDALAPCRRGDAYVMEQEFLVAAARRPG